MILVGTALGVTLLVNLPRPTGMLLLGLFVLGFARLHSVPHDHRKGSFRRAGPGSPGFAGGITSTMFGAGGPPYAIYLSQRGLTRSSSAPRWASPR